jgi:hypothetical protein
MKAIDCEIEFYPRARTRHMPYAIGFLVLLSFAFLLAASPAVFAQNPISLRAAHDGERYSEQLPFEGGTKPITYVQTSGQLPTGITVDASSGALTGTVTADAARPTLYTFEVQATDSAFPAHNIVKQVFMLVVDANKPLQILSSAPLPTTQFILTSSSNDEETVSLDQVVGANPIGGVNPTSLSIGDGNALIATTVGTDPAAQYKVGDYCVVHLIRWKPATEGKSEPAKQTWALFERVLRDGNEVWEPRFDPKDKDKLTYQDRIFGSKRVIVLMIHFDTPPTWDIKYKVGVNQQTPTPISNVLALAGAIGSPGKIAALRTAAVTAPKTVWGARLMLVKYTASELLVKVNAVTSTANGEPVEQSKEYSMKYTDEGRYHWDVSIGLPVKTLRELTFVSDATNGNRIATSAKERQDVYGFFNYFPKAVDLKGEHFLTWPHFLLGVPLAGKPLQRPILGIGTGMYKAPIKFNIFAGVVFIRERVPTTLNVGQQASQTQLDNDLHTRWVRKFTFGINFPIGQIKQAIK